MDRTFNNGLGMILVVGKRHVDGVMSMLKKMRERHFMIGEIKKGRREVILFPEDKPCDDKFPSAY